MAKIFALQSRYKIAVGVAIVQATVVFFLLRSHFWASSSTSLPLDACAQDSTDQPPKTEVSLSLNGPPTSAFRDNLRPELKYITSWPVNGWSNQVIEYMNLIYLAQLTGSVPIIPRFRPVHMGSNASHLDFGDVFDIPRLQTGLGAPILQWREVKDLKSKTVDHLGCWDLQNKSWDNERIYLEPPVDLKLDISYTRTQNWAWGVNGDGGGNASMLLWPLAALISFNQRAASLGRLPPAEASPLHRVSLPPDSHLFCCNSLYFGISALEAAADIDPAWQTVGRHMHWTSTLQDTGMSYIRRTLGVEANEPIPPFLALHVRRGDFMIWCNVIHHMPMNKCFAPLSAYARRVNEVRAELLERMGTRADHVIVTSDETSHAWWWEVSQLGWLRVEHSYTVEKYGAWYPMFIDAVIQATASGFVGTATSTVSILAHRRVADMGGVSRMVKWGRPGADDD
ncbi:hypothetical protein B0H13DRAFT_2307050 [Mycena leptocephala]|nr:hypothetical protein B0H13DRAFT_2307050 [Mycena leptocephala]